MKTCKVRPSYGECCSCGDTADFFGGVPKCSECGYKTLRYELLEIVSGFFNDYAFVSRGGKIIKVSLDRIYDIMEEDKTFCVLGNGDTYKEAVRSDEKGGAE